MTLFVFLKYHHKIIIFNAPEDNMKLLLDKKMCLSVTE